MLNTTISFLSTARTPNGTKLNPCEGIKKLAEFARGKEKQNLPVIYPYRGVKGEYSNSNTFFIDIDTTKYVDDVINNSDEIFGTLSNILYMQKSYSGKLHLICVFEEQDSAAAWSYAATLNTIAILHVLKTQFGYDFLSIQGAVDTHSLKFTQALYISGSEVIENPFGGCLLKFDRKDVNKLIETYPQYFDGTKKQKQVLMPAELDESQLVNLDYFNESKKISVDKNLTVGEYNGNDLRWRIGRELYYLLGSEEAAKTFCEQHFTNANEIKIYTKYPENKVVKNWLLTTFHRTIVDNTPKTKIEGYLMDYYDQIKDLYNENKRILIKAPTGVGKTILTKRLANEYNAVVLVPFNSMLKLYTKDENLNGLEIKGLNEVSSRSENKYSTDSPCVMVWDQAYKYDLSNRLVISDETHQWFNDRTYRMSAVKTMDLAKRWERLVCISATPSGEQYTLQLPVFEFYKERKDINTVICHTDQPGEYINEFIKSFQLNKTKYDKMCVFSDAYAQRLYQNNEGSVLIHSITRDSEEFQSMLANERIDGDVTILTSLAFNGLNFMNENEKILVIIDCQEGKDTANKIIQAAGRFRKADVDLCIVFKTQRSTDDKQTINEKRSDALKLDEFVEENNDSWISVDSRLLFDDSYCALNEIEQYNTTHSTQEMIIKELCEAGYFTPIRHQYMPKAKLEPIQLKKKHEQNEEFVEMVMNENIDEDELTDYQRGWNNAIRKISEQTKVDWGSVVGTYKKGTLMDTIIEDIVYIIKVTKLSDEEFKRITSDDKMKKLKEMGCSKICLAKQKKYINKIKKIRSEWELFSTSIFEDDSIDEFMKYFIDGRVALKDELRQKQSNGGAKSHPKQKIILRNKQTDELIEFESKTDCMNFLGISNPTFCKFLKGITKKNVEFEVVD